MRYVFGDYVLDTQRYELRRGTETVALAPKVFDVLAYLVEHHDRVVSKQELFDRLWPEQFVTDDALGRCIRAARQWLGDDTKTPQYIATVRGRGYRLIAAVQVLSPRGGPEDGLDPVNALARDVSPPDDLTHEGATEVGSIEPGAVSALPPMAAFEGEYKQVTALCGTLASALTVAERVGPERMHLLMQRVFTVVQHATQRYAGTLMEFSGDRFLALFGAPVAQEDHGPRAVLAALAIRRRLQAADDEADPAGAERLRLTMGLHTGRVVVGQLSAASNRFYTAVGETTQVAYQLSQQAVAGEIFISAAVGAMLPENVHAERYEAALSPSLCVYRIDGSKAAHAVSPVGRTRSPFVGREREMAMLHERLALALDGQGQVIGLAGEPGMGKSRLLAEFRHRLQPERVSWYEGHCLSYGAATPYLSVSALLRQMMGAAPEEAPTAVAIKTRQLLRTVNMPSDEALPLLLQLLDVADTPLDLSPQRLKERTFAVMRQLVLRLAQRQPLVIAIENLHWIDATSEAWFASLVERLPQTTLLLLATYRPGYQPSWLMQSVATQAALTRLPPEDSCEVVRSILSTAQVTDEHMQAVIAKADGNPLFLEALAWDMAEHAGQALSTAIPETVQAVITARIDRLLPVEKSLLQMAAAIGTSIAATLLVAVSELPADELPVHLSALQTAEFLLEEQAFPEPVYVFKHVLIQEVAYQSLVARTRQHYHQRIAEILITRFPETVKHQPEMLAHHFTQAASYDAAVPYWHQAGMRAQAQSAHREAISHFNHGLGALAQLPVTPAYQEQALDLRLVAAPSLIATEGFATPQVGQFYQHTRQLCEHVGNARQLGRALMGLRSFHLMRAELQDALNTDQLILQLGEQAQDPLLLSDGHRGFGQTLMHLGEFVTARTHLEQALDIYASLPDDTDIPIGPSGLHPRMSALFWLSSVLWFLGYPDEAMRRSDEANGLADEQAHPFNYVSAFGYRGAMHRLRGEWEAVRECLETAVSLSAKYGLMPQIHRTSHQGAILASAWHDPAAFEQMRQDIDAYQATGTSIRLPVYWLDLAAAYHKAGDIAAGMTTLNEALQHISQTQERWFEAECYRMRGELLLAQSKQPQHVQDAETDLRQALAIAEQQAANSWRLRAAMSLCRLWRQQGRVTEAKVLLTSVYSEFTEGFDTLDVCAAKQLLNELGKPGVQA